MKKGKKGTKKARASRPDRKKAKETKSTGKKALESLPMYVMWTLGALIFYQLGWLFAVTYLFYCVFSIIWFMRMICVYCGNARMNRCSSGMGQMSSRLFEPRSLKDFRRQFKYNVTCQFPVWFVPPIAAGYLLYEEFSYIVVVLLVVFLIEAFGIYPYMSTRKTCEDCTMRNVCPYKRGK